MPNAWKILVVEDDPELRDALIEQLALQEEFEPVGADTAGGAVEQARTGRSTSSSWMWAFPTWMAATPCGRCAATASRRPS